MADRAVPPSIEPELTRIMSAVYGEEVRGSIHDALEKMNTQLVNAILNQLVQVDATLTQSGYGADAKKVGDLLTNSVIMRTDPAAGANLNLIVETGIYRLLGSNSYVNAWKPVNESGTVISASPGFLEVVRNASNCKQTLYYLNSSHNFGQRCAVRFTNNATAPSPTWSEWLENVDDTLEVYGLAADAKSTGDAVRDLRTNYLNLGTNNKSSITMGGNLNSVITAGSYRVTSTSVTNLPEDTLGILYVFTITSTSNIYQWYITQNGDQYSRTKSGNVWTSWKKGSSGAGESIASPHSPTASYVAGDYVTYKDKLWKCVSDTSGSWNASKWREAIVMDEMQALKSDVIYTPVAISSFTVNPSTAEMGSALTSIKYSFTINKVPITLTLDGSALTPSSKVTEQTLSGLSISTNKTFTLQAKDNGSSSYSPATSTKTATISFLNNRFYGVKAIPETVDSAFVLGLGNKELASEKAKTFTVNAGSAGNGIYIWFASPVRLGACKFTVGGFEGGFEPAETVSVTNSSGFTENYYVYRSTQDGLGTTTVVVS